MNRSSAFTRIPARLLVLLIVYCIASLIHFVHNAEFVADYPNLPAWLTRPKVYLAWLVITSVGVAGLVFLRLHLRVLGLLMIAVYAALGFAGLDHYWMAPVDAHSAAMNATIGFEVVSAAALLVTTLLLAVRNLRTRAIAPN